jgi:hypothetical protein
MRAVLLALAALALVACSRDFPPTPTPTPLGPTPTAPESARTLVYSAMTPTPWLYPWTDESVTMSGICFESAQDAAGRTFVIRSAEALRGFFDLADNSELCSQPVRRHEFDFSGGRVLAGLWSAASGCRARHEIESVRRDDTARTLFIYLRLIKEGDCLYELVRPFWIGINDAADYEIQFVVS